MSAHTTRAVYRIVEHRRPRMTALLVLCEYGHLYQSFTYRPGEWAGSQGEAIAGTQPERRITCDGALAR